MSGSNRSVIARNAGYKGAFLRCLKRTFVTLTLAALIISSLAFPIFAADDEQGLHKKTCHHFGIREPAILNNDAETG